MFFLGDVPPRSMASMSGTLAYAMVMMHTDLSRGYGLASIRM
jgi:hypothetical protein